MQSGVTVLQLAQASEVSGCAAGKVGGGHLCRGDPSAGGCTSAEFRAVNVEALVWPIGL